MDSAASKVTCAFCANKAGYSCPKCSKPYCSLSCYKSVAHQSCSEEFYKDNVHLNMKVEPDLSVDDQRKMVEILEKFNMEDGSDTQWKYQVPEEVADKKRQVEEEWEDELTAEELAELEETVDEATVEQLWDMLTEEEKKDFKKMIEGREL